MMSPLAWHSIYDIVLAGKYSLIEAHVLGEDLASGPLLCKMYSWWTQHIIVSVDGYRTLFEQHCQKEGWYLDFIL